MRFVKIEFLILLSPTPFFLFVGSMNFFFGFQVTRLVSD